MKTIKISKADSIFSKQIRTRDTWTCQRCGKPFEPPTSGLHCAHFIGRGNKCTRFDFDNCVALCYGCHSYFDGRGREEFRTFMMTRLGKKGFASLIQRSIKTCKFGAFELQAKVAELLTLDK